MTHEISFLIIGAIIGAILGLAITLWWEGRKSRRKDKVFSEIYSMYEGIYLAFKKYSTDETDINKAAKYFELVREKNLFTIKDGISLSGNKDFTGQIRMSEAIYSSGNGYYQHSKDDHNVIRFGFLEIQLTLNGILAHETIYNDEGTQNSDGYRWVKQETTRKDEILNECRKIQQQKSIGR